MVLAGIDFGLGVVVSVEVAISFALIVEQLARRFRLPRTKGKQPPFYRGFARISADQIGSGDRRDQVIGKQDHLPQIYADGR